MNFAQQPAPIGQPAIQPQSSTTEVPSGGVEPPSRIRQGGAVQQSMLLYQARPIYPADAKAARITGIVILEVLVGRDGAVSDIRVLSGHPTLQQAAIDAVRQWLYKPTLLNGNPVEVQTTVTVNFSFQQ